MTNTPRTQVGRVPATSVRRALAGASSMALSVVLFGAASVAAQAPADKPTPPPYYAIEGARVMTVSGDSLESATVVIAEGLITAIGTDVDIPGDAWVIDGEGLTVYPGLIDALTSRGLEKPESESSDSGGGFPFGGSGPTIRGPEDRPKTTTWLEAAESLDDDEEAFLDWRKAGFTTALIASDEGIFPGRGSVVALSDQEDNNRVVREGAVQRIRFPTGGFGSYPGSLMGVIAYVDQTLMDAAWYQKAQALYDQDPTNRERPLFDRALGPLAQAIESATPFLLPANNGREIDRALLLAENHSLEAVLTGGQSAWQRRDQLALSKTPVIIDLEWPEEKKDRDPDRDPAYTDLLHRLMAPRTPGLLAEAGVPFAFSSGGLTSPDKVFEAVRKAVDEGLDSDRALRAMTLDAARILGVDDRVGSVEVGKIANLVIASGEPWAEDAEIHSVMIDGRIYRERAEPEGDSEPPTEDASGTWDLVLDTPQGNQEMTAEFEMAEDGKVTGEVDSERLGKRSVKDARVSGDLLTFTVSAEFGGQSVDVGYNATLAGDALDGSVSAGPMTFDMSGTRTASPETDEGGDAPATEITSVPTEELLEVERLRQGVVTAMDSYAITNATVWTVSGDTLENATVLVDDGKITTVGGDVAVPSGATVIDAEGGHLIPGIIDAHSHIAIEGGVNEGSLAVTSMVGTGDVIDPDDIAIYRALAGGVTTANLLHGSANPIGGRNAVVKLLWGQPAAAMRLDSAPKGIKFALGENPKRSRNFGPIPPRYPATRMGVMDVIRQSFLDAREYQKEWQAWESAQKNRKRDDRELIPPRRDRELEALAEILEGTRLVHSHCYREDEILQLIRLADEMGFKIATLQHVLEGYKVADEIAAHGAGASTFSDWWGYKVEAYDAIPHNAALMTDRGVLVSINSDSDEEMRHLNLEAAKSIKWGGLDEVAAMALVTLNPAKQLRIDDRVGSIEVGKDADLVLYDGHPFSTFSVVQKTFIDGDVYFDIDHDRKRQAAINDMKERLLGDGEDGGDESDASETPSGTTPVTPDLQANAGLEDR